MDFGRQFVGILFCEHLRSLRGANSWHQAKKPQKCFSDFRSILIKCVPPILVLKKIRQIVCSQKQKREKRETAGILIIVYFLQLRCEPL